MKKELPAQFEHRDGIDSENSPSVKFVFAMEIPHTKSYIDLGHDRPKNAQQNML